MAGIDFGFEFIYGKFENLCSFFIFFFLRVCNYEAKIWNNSWIFDPWIWESDSLFKYNYYLFEKILLWINKKNPASF